MCRVEKAEDASPSLERANFCAIDGMGAKISDGARSTSGTVKAAQCRSTLIRCLGGMCATYSEKGNDTTTEAERVLRSRAAISLKRPFQTAETCISARIHIKLQQFFVRVLRISLLYYGQKLYGVEHFSAGTHIYN